MGVVVGAGVLRSAVILAAATCCVAHNAAAEDLILPYVCSYAKGEPRVLPSGATRYQVFGLRDEQPFVSCTSGQPQRCETMMVHRFALLCDRTRIPWAKFAAAARSAGVVMPKNLPNGFAPVSPLAGRFILPALALSDSGLDNRVAKQDLSPDSVLDDRDIREAAPQRAWATVVQTGDGDAVAVAEADAGGALRVAGALAGLVLLLMAASLMAAQRWRAAGLVIAALEENWRKLHRIAGPVVRGVWQGLSINVTRSYRSFQSGEANAADEQVVNGLLTLHARLAEADLVVATLPAAQLMQDTLRAEIDRVRDRIIEADRRKAIRPTAKTASLIRSMLRDLERIIRIAQGASWDQPQHERRDAESIPRSPHEAYQVLGLNADAPAAAAKKLVDALRMTWHPDHARDAPDRERRESRMKQINAAWDLIRQRPEAA